MWRPALAVTLSDWFFLVAFLLIVLEMLVRNRIEIQIQKYLVVGLIVFFTGGILSSVATYTPILSIIALLKYVYLIGIWFWIGTVVLRRPRHINIAVILWTISAATSGAGAISQLVWGDIIPHATITWGRMSGFTEHVNDLAGVTSVALVPALVIVTHSADRIWRLPAAFMLVFMIGTGLILSISISGVVAALVSLLIWITLGSVNRKLQLKNIVVFTIASTLILIVTILQTDYAGLSVLSRFGDISTEGTEFSTLASRLDTYNVAWDIILRNPVIGVGLGPSIGITDTGHQVHNLFLLSWYEAGLFGFIGMLIITGTVFWIGVKIIRCPFSHYERRIGVSLFASYIGFLILSMAQPIYYKRFGWISAALLLAVYALRRLPITLYSGNTKPR